MESSTPQKAFIERMTSLSDEQQMKLLNFHDNGCLEELLKMDGEHEIKPLVELRKEKPQVLKDIFSDNVSAEPVLDYIQDLEARVDIFKRYHRLSHDNQAAGVLDAAVFSVFMVAPIAQLESHLQKIETLVAEKDLAGIGSHFAVLNTIRFGIQAYVNKRGRQTQSVSNSNRNSTLPSPAKVPTPSNPLKRKLDSDDQIPSGSNLDLQASVLPTAAPLWPSTPLANAPTSTMQQSPRSSQDQNASNSSKQSRNNTMSKLCKSRDDFKCVLTRSEDPEAAHIFPLGTSKHRHYSFLISMIKMYWDPNQASSWYSMMQNKNVLDSPQNLISLNHQLHWWFDNGKLALKPLRKLDDGSIVIQFHWLKSHNLKPATRLPDGDLDMYQWMQRAGLTDNSSWGGMRLHRWSGIPIETGQTFILKATDPGRIPSFELLQLSWDLLRMIAICGAAEAEDIDDEGSGSGDFGAEDFETNVSIWSEDDYVQLRHWAGDIENRKELEDDANSSS